MGNKREVIVKSSYEDFPEWYFTKGQRPNFMSGFFYKFRAALVQIWVKIPL